MYSEQLAWKRSISPTLATHERVSLIATIFSDDTQAETVRQLTGEDAQTFIDTIDGVSPRTTPRLKDTSADLDSNLYVFSTRHGMASRQRPVGVVCTIYAGFVEIESYFRDRWKFHFAMTQRTAR